MIATLRMKRLLLALAPWMAITMAFSSPIEVAQVVYTHHLPVKDGVVRVADECYVPVFAVEDWGWRVELSRDSVKLTAEGKEITVPVRTVGGRQTIPLRATFEQLGADSAWESNTDTLYARSPIKSVRVDDAQIFIESALTIEPRVFALENPARLVIDLRGASLPSDLKLELPATATAKQYAPDTVRIMVETSLAAELAKAQLQTAATLTFSLVQGEQVLVPPPGEDTQQPVVETVDPASAPVELEVKPPTIANLLVELEGKSAILMSIGNIGSLTAPARFRKPSPAVLEILLPGTNVELPPDFKLGSKSIKSAEVMREGDVSVLRLTLSRPMGAEVLESSGQVRLQLLKPDVGNGRLSGQLIVVDAGHGGVDGGARSGKVREKDLTLTIAKLTSQKLAREGATVIMTRNTDAAVALKDRSGIANANGADLFLSIHINSNKTVNSTSGSITFHHKGSQIGKLLAECIQNEIVDVSGLPNMGVWSDGKIYQNGFSVLRNAKMPAVLLELGFINHSGDRRRMVTKDFHEQIAAAIVRGLRVYLGDVK